MTANRSTLDALARLAGEPAAPATLAAAPPAEKEEGWLQVVSDYARLCDWLVYHTRDSRRSARGFPDLTMVRDGRLVFAELKTNRGSLTRPQKQWIGRLAVSVPGIEVYLWRPRDWPTVERTLR